MSEKKTIGNVVHEGIRHKAYVVTRSQFMREKKLFNQTQMIFEQN